MAEATAGEYICVTLCETIKDHKVHKPGDKIKLNAEQAKILLAKGAVKVK